MIKNINNWDIRCLCSSRLFAACIFCLISGCVSTNQLPRNFRDAQESASAMDLNPEAVYYYSDKLEPENRKVLFGVMDKCLKSFKLSQSISLDLVFAIGNKGQVVGTWQVSDDAVTSCVAYEVSKTVYPTPPVSPFFFETKFNLNAKNIASK